MGLDSAVSRQPVGLNGTTTETAGHTAAAALRQRAFRSFTTRRPGIRTIPATRSRPYYLRSDMYGRPLPFSPKLPVSTGLLYSGESGESPLLQ